MEINESYEHLRFKNAETPFILHSFHFADGHSRGRHNWHESIELLYITEGAATVSCDTQILEVKKGDVVVINSHTIHNIRTQSDTHFYCLIIDRAFCVANYIDTNTLLFKNLVNDREIQALIEQFADEYRDRTAPCRIQLLRSTALRILALLKSRHAQDALLERQEATTFSSVKATLGYIHSNCQKKISLDELAAFSGISKYYLAREFRKLVGCTIVDYINRVRCENAKRMLQENQQSIAGIALSCGYPNPSYFTKIFVRTMGVHPHQYKEQVRHENHSLSQEG